MRQISMSSTHRIIQVLTSRQDSLKAAMDAANELGSQKLADQIGNTITFFTRQFVVGDNSD